MDEESTKKQYVFRYVKMVPGERNVEWTTRDDKNHFIGCYEKLKDGTESWVADFATKEDLENLLRRKVNIVEVNHIEKGDNK